ncbi:hypothetical protein H4582DRAFT_2068258 [Lactarius indigo]|nr:hypothetical protein H4582DRAFT_2068258 [Lactarius indigo]
MRKKAEDQRRTKSTAAVAITGTPARVRMRVKAPPGTRESDVESGKAGNALPVLASATGHRNFRFCICVSSYVCPICSAQVTPSHEAAEEPSPSPTRKPVSPLRCHLP